MLPNLAEEIIRIGNKDPSGLGMAIFCVAAQEIIETWREFVKDLDLTETEKMHIFIGIATRKVEEYANSDITELYPKIIDEYNFCVKNIFKKNVRKLDKSLKIRFNIK